MANITYPVTLANDTTADADDVMADFDAVTAQVNGNIEAVNLKDGAATAPKIADGAVTPAKLDSALADELGITAGATTRRGQLYIPTEESRNNTAFGLMPTPDRIQNVTVPANGLIWIVYRARWWETNLAASEAAIFFNGTQLHAYSQPAATDPVIESAAISNVSSTNAGTARVLLTDSVGLVTQNGNTAINVDDTIPVALGEKGNDETGGGGGKEASFYLNNVILYRYSGGSGVCLARAPAGVYTISVQFRADVGTVTTDQRYLAVWTTGF